MTYSETVQFLYSLGNEIKTAKLGLERISAVLNALGNPQNAFRVVHVAGTNGKGSTCAMIEAGLREAGYRTGLFISPHLQEPTERIQIDGMAVSAGEFERAFEAVHGAAEALDLDCHPTYFETVTGMAFFVFRERRVDFAVIETGLGGRLDATNVVVPVLTVITPIDLDHQDFLGNTITAVAGEKAGILKPGVPAVIARQLPDAMAVIAARAQELQVTLTRVEDFTIREREIDALGSRFRLDSVVEIVECPLAGEHQTENAATAALALGLLGVGPAGIAETRWPGRLEHVAPNPDIILDGAHNPAGARALAAYLRRFYSHRRIWLIFAAMRDKSVEEMAAVLFPLAHELVFTAPEYFRALPPERLREIAGRGHVEADPAAALAYVQQQAEAEDVIVISGSLYLVGEARALLSRHSQGWPAIVEIQ